jgi:hypothetical protein
VSKKTTTSSSDKKTNFISNTNTRKSAPTIDANNDNDTNNNDTNNDKKVDTNNTAVASSNTNTNTKFKIDEKVDCNYKNNGRWYTGKITSISSDGYTVTYDDGDVESNVNEDLIRNINTISDSNSNSNDNNIPKELEEDVHDDEINITLKVSL